MGEDRLRRAPGWDRRGALARTSDRLEALVGERTETRDDRAGAMGLSGDQVRRVLTLAGLAPSVHNTQPWRFALSSSAIEVHADPALRLPVTDPDGVEMRMSCGAALLNLQLGLAEVSVRPDVRTMPDPGQPDLLAVVRVVGTRSPDPEQLALIRAIPRRRTNRSPFEDPPVSAAHLHELRRAALREGGHLPVVDTPDTRAELARLPVRAHRRQLNDPAFRAELDHWTGRVGEHADGIPARTAGPPPAPGDPWVLWDLGGERRPTPRSHSGSETEPSIAVLSVAPPWWR